MAHASNQFNAEHPMRTVLTAVLGNLQVGYSNSLWLTDPHEFEAVCSATRMRRVADSYVYDAHHALSLTVAYHIDCWLWLGPDVGVSKYGDLHIGKKFFSDFLSLDPLDVKTDPTLGLPTSSLCHHGNAICRFAALGEASLKTLHKYKLTFNEVEQTFDSTEGIRNFMHWVGWETEQFTLASAEFWVSCFRVRHFLLAKSEIELSDFTDTLPRLTDKYDTWGQTHLAGCDEDGKVCEMLGMPREGIKRCKSWLARFPFNPVLVISNLLDLASLLERSGATVEATECYTRAVTEAKRMELRMMELMALHKQSATKEGHGVLIGNTISKMVDDPASSARSSTTTTTTRTRRTGSTA